MWCPQGRWNYSTLKWFFKIISKSSCNSSSFITKITQHSHSVLIFPTVHSISISQIKTHSSQLTSLCFCCQNSCDFSAFSSSSSYSLVLQKRLIPMETPARRPIVPPAEDNASDHPATPSLVSMANLSVSPAFFLTNNRIPTRMTAPAWKHEKHTRKWIHHI